MKRVLIFLLVLTIPIGFLTGAAKAIGALQDDVVITPEHLYGDPGRVAGRRVQILTTLNDHIWWHTDYTAGEPGTAETTFHFSQQEKESEVAVDQMEFYLSVSSGVGMSTSGGDGFAFEDNGIGRLAGAVADRTQPGETRDEELLLAEYMDDYPMTYRNFILNDKYYIDEYYDDIDFFGSNNETKPAFDKWMELFRFPILEDQKIEVSLTKDYDGAVRELSFNLIDAPQIGFDSYVAQEGIYLSPFYRDWEGNPILTGAFPEGYGLYYIPFEVVHPDNVKADGRTLSTVTYDFGALELVCGLAPEDKVVAMEANGDESQLHMVLLEDGMYRYSVLDLRSRQIIRNMDIAPAEKDSDCWYRFFQEQELLYLGLGTKAALVDISAEPKVEFVVAWPEEVTAYLPESILYTDGVLYMTALDWKDNEQIFYLAACDENGLGYFGHYYSSLKRREANSGNGYVSMDEIILMNNG